MQVLLVAPNSALLSDRDLWRGLLLCDLRFIFHCLAKSGSICGGQCGVWSSTVHLQGEAPFLTRWSEDLLVSVNAASRGMHHDCDLCADHHLRARLQDSPELATGSLHSDLRAQL